MSLFTERNGMRNAVEKTTTITVDMYCLLFNCCERYYDNIAWRYPQECPDGSVCCGLDLQMFNSYMKFEIPNLYRGAFETIDKPSKPSSFFSVNDDNYDQYALLDFIEFIYANCKDISKSEWHAYFKHNDLTFSDTKESAEVFRNEINNIFEKTGLLYYFTDKGEIERITQNEVLSEKVQQNVTQIKEKGLRVLITEAIEKHKSPHPQDNKEAVNKIWDALERMKSYYATSKSKKKESIDKIVSDMSHGDEYYKKLFNDEIQFLTDYIGNACNIRHSEVYQHEIIDEKYYDYFFDRCLSLIALAIQYLPV